MKMITENILDLIGSTPIVSLEPSTGMKIFAKAEFLNPGGSIKDRVAKNMIEQAEKRGVLKKGMTIVEPTSGNTGIGLALCGVRMGYNVIIVMPENMSEERKKIIRALGAELVLTPAEESLDGAVNEGFIPSVLDTSLIDEVVTVTDEDAIGTTRMLARKQGLMCGTSSGANIWACMQMAEKYGKDKIIATVLPDRMERYRHRQQ